LEDETLGPDPQAEEGSALEDAPEPNEKLEVVFTTNDESEALVVKGLLESNGLQVQMSTPESPVSIFPGVANGLGRITLTVRAELAAQARRLIDESERAGPAAAEEAERAGEKPES
jgi:hypothetical protein